MNKHAEYNGSPITREEVVLYRARNRVHRRIATLGLWNAKTREATQLSVKLAVMAGKDVD